MRKHDYLNALLLLLLFLLVAGCRGDRAIRPEIPTTIASATIAPSIAPEHSVTSTAPRIRQKGFVPLFADPALPDSPDAYLDLDTGAVEDVTGGDIKFVISQGSGTSYILEPSNGAMAAPMAGNGAGFEGCKRSIPSLSEGDLPEIEAGNYFCVLTNQGLLSQLRIDAVDHLGTGSMQVSFTTWEEVVMPN